MPSENEAEIMASLAVLRELGQHTKDSLKRLEDEVTASRSLALDIRGLIIGQDQLRKDLSGANKAAQEAHVRIDGLSSSIDNAKGAAKVINLVFGVVISFILVGLAALFNWLTAKH